MSAQMETNCPKKDCNSPARRGARYCPRCGASLLPQESKQPAAASTSDPAPGGPRWVLLLSLMLVGLLIGMRNARVDQTSPTPDLHAAPGTVEWVMAAPSNPAKQAGATHATTYAHADLVERYRQRARTAARKVRGGDPLVRVERCD